MSEKLPHYPGIDSVQSHEIVGKVPIIHLAGSIAAGKETASEIFAKNYGFSHFTFSNILKNEAVRQGFTPPFQRETLRRISFELLNDPTKGVNFYIDKAFGSLSQEQRAHRHYGSVLDGSRIESVSSAVLALPLSVGIWIDADPDVRFSRFLHRGASQAQIDELEQVDKIENEQMTPIREMSDFVITNNGSIEDLAEQIRDVMAIRFGMPPFATARERSLYTQL